MNPTLTSDKIYQIAKSSLNHHITLDESVPHEVGCAEAVSYVLKNAGVTGMPSTGFASTTDLYRWLDANIEFEKIDAPEKGCIVISPTGYSSINYPHGHVGIVGIYGILSNSSLSGLFEEDFTLESWNQYFNVRRGFPIYYYRAL